MKLLNIHNDIVLENEKKYAKKIEKYNFMVLNNDAIANHEKKDLLLDIRSSGAWLLQDNTNLLCEIENGVQVVVGFHPLRLHLGHLALIKELSFYAPYKADFIFIVANYENGNISKRIIDDFWNVFSNYCDISHCSNKVYWDDKFPELAEMTNIISEHFTVNKILQTFGWDNTTSVHRIVNALVGTSSFLIVNKLKKRNTVVLLDINQMPFYALSKTAAKKCNLELPSFEFINLFPSIRDIKKRMSIKDNKSTIFLDECDAEIEKKLNTVFTGQSSLKSEGTFQIHTCCFFRIMELLYESENLEEIINECECNASFCHMCKRRNIPRIIERINSIRKDIY